MAGREAHATGPHAQQALSAAAIQQYQQLLSQNASATAVFVAGGVAAHDFAARGVRPLQHHQAARHQFDAAGRAALHISRQAASDQASLASLDASQLLLLYQLGRISPTQLASLQQILNHQQQRQQQQQQQLHGLGVQRYGPGAGHWALQLNAAQQAGAERYASRAQAAGAAAQGALLYAGGAGEGAGNARAGSGGSGPSAWQGQPAAMVAGVAAAGAGAAAAAAAAAGVAAGPAAGGGPPPPPAGPGPSRTTVNVTEPYGMQQQQHLAQQHALQAARFQTWQHQQQLLAQQQQQLAQRLQQQQQHQQYAARSAGPASADALRRSAAAGAAGAAAAAAAGGSGAASALSFTGPRAVRPLSLSASCSPSRSGPSSASGTPTSQLQLSACGPPLSAPIPVSALAGGAAADGPESRGSANSGSGGGSGGGGNSSSRQRKGRGSGGGGGSGRPPAGRGAAGAGGGGGGEGEEEDSFVESSGGSEPGSGDESEEYVSPNLPMCETASGWGSLTAALLARVMGVLAAGAALGPMAPTLRAVCRHWRSVADAHTEVLSPNVMKVGVAGVALTMRLYGYGSGSLLWFAGLWGHGLGVARGVEQTRWWGWKGAGVACSMGRPPPLTPGSPSLQVRAIVTRFSRLQALHLDHCANIRNRDLLVLSRGPVRLAQLTLGDDRARPWCPTAAWATCAA